MYIINTNSAVFQDQSMRPINSAISVVFQKHKQNIFVELPRAFSCCVHYHQYIQTDLKSSLDSVKLHIIFKRYCYTQYHYFENK